MDPSTLAPGLHAVSAAIEPIRAAGFFDTTNGLIGKTGTLINGGSYVAGAGMVLLAWLKQRTITALVVAGIVAGVALFLIHNTHWSQDKTGGDLTGAGAVSQLIVPTH